MKRVVRGDPEYETVRRDGIWQQLKPDRYPDEIVQVATPGDAVLAVRRANGANLAIALKGSGHNYTSTYLRDGGMLLDLSGLNSIVIEGDGVRVGPGARSADVCAALNAVGRALPTGHHAGVTMGGYLLGGGMGWNGESWGQFACFNVEALDVVLASGEPITISKESHPDLFRAARGAGPLFCAAVTRFHLRTYSLPTAVLAVRRAYPLNIADKLSDWLEQEGLKARPDVETILMFESDVDLGIPLAKVLILYHGSDVKTGTETLAEMLACAPDGGNGSPDPVPLDYAALYAESLTGDPQRTGADTIWTDEPSRAARILAKHFADVPSNRSVGIVNFRGEPQELPDAACSMAGSGFLQWIGQWRDPQADTENFAWVERVAQALEPVTKGCYVNETDILRRPERLRRCFTEEAWRRLRRVRETYDPHKRFPVPPPDSR